MSLGRIHPAANVGLGLPPSWWRSCRPSQVPAGFRPLQVVQETAEGRRVASCTRHRRCGVTVPRPSAGNAFSQAV
eukprot:6182776-Pleurochrysis_carterae.AAC.2